MTPPLTVQELRAWLEARTDGGPSALRDRVLEQAAMIEEGDTAAEQVALAAERVLAIVEEHPGDRGISLDLLAADALITLALLAQAEADPDQLGAFTEGLLAAERIV